MDATKKITTEKPHVMHLQSVVMLLLNQISPVKTSLVPSVHLDTLALGKLDVMTSMIALVIHVAWLENVLMMDQVLENGSASVPLVTSLCPTAKMLPMR